jgi:hypothetical protein
MQDDELRCFQRTILFDTVRGTGNGSSRMLRIKANFIERTYFIIQETTQHI